MWGTIIGEIKQLEFLQFRFITNKVSSDPIRV